MTLNMASCIGGWNSYCGDNNLVQPVLPYALPPPPHTTHLPVILRRHHLYAGFATLSMHQTTSMRHTSGCKHTCCVQPPP
jgi:hypothetical protein